MPHDRRTVLAPPHVLPPELDLMPLSRRPCRLPDHTLRVAMNLELPVRHQLHRKRRANVVIVTHNQLPFTRLCLQSVLTEADNAGYALEVVVVDNCSTDGTQAYLKRAQEVRPDVRVILNADNRGFAAATNQGLSASAADLLVLLNNDTLVPPSWLDPLERRASEADIGLVGPVTNRTCNEAQVDTGYRTWAGFVASARQRSVEMKHVSFDIPMAAMFCVAMRREVYQRLGPLDEQFGIGMFEDDDYSMRARNAGYRVICAEDVLVHHFGEASFGELVAGGRYGTLLEENRRRFERKWGVPWTAHCRRPSAAYEALVQRVRSIVAHQIPPGATVFCASRGDERLLKFDGDRLGRHFPQDSDGGYAHQYPADDGAAIAQLPRRRDEDPAAFLVFPAPSFWWFEFYCGFVRHLDATARRTWDDETCRIYQLG